MCCSEHGQLFFIFQLNEKKGEGGGESPASLLRANACLFGF